MPDGSAAERLERLEREIQRVTRLADAASSSARALAFVLAGVLLGGGSWLAWMYSQGRLHFESITGGVARTVETREFGFYNHDGTRVFLVDEDKFGYPNLILMDLKKKYKMGLKVFSDGGGTPGLAFYDDSGPRGHLRMDGGGASVLKLTGPHEKGSITLSVSEQGDPRVIVSDRAGKVLFAVPDGAREEKPPEGDRASVMGGQVRPSGEAH